MSRTFRCCRPTEVRSNVHFPTFFSVASSMYFLLFCSLVDLCLYCGSLHSRPSFYRSLLITLLFLIFVALSLSVAPSVSDLRVFSSHYTPPKNKVSSNLARDPQGQTNMKARVCTTRSESSTFSLLRPTPASKCVHTAECAAVAYSVFHMMRMV